MEQLDLLFQTYFYQFCDICKWIFCVRVASEIIKKTNENDMQGLLKSIFTCAVGYACLYSVVTVLDSVQKTFGR